MTAQLSREELQQIADTDHVQCGDAAAMARMLLAGMSAKSRKLFTCTGCGAEGLDEPLESKCHCNEDGAHWAESVVFTAPPAPVAVPDALEQFALFMAEEAIKSGEDQSGWRGKASNAAHEYALACRAAMQVEPVTAAKVPPHIYRELVNQLRDTAVKYQGCQQLREQLSATLRTVITPAAPEQEV